MAKTHGKSKTKAFSVWASMKRRCYNPNQENYYLYGKRGISVCEKWQTFEGFYSDMGDPPDGMSLDRIDNEGNYTKENCRWASLVDQANNKRTSRNITAFLQTHTAKEWERITGINRTTISSRIDKYRWTPERAVSIRKRQNKKIGRPVSIVLEDDMTTRSADKRTETPMLANLARTEETPIRDQCANQGKTPTLD